MPAMTRRWTASPPRSGRFRPRRAEPRCRSCCRPAPRAMPSIARSGISRPRRPAPGSGIWRACPRRAPRSPPSRCRSTRPRTCARRRPGMPTGHLSNRKGVNVPDVVLPVAALSEKDREDLHFALDLGVDWVALSFVQRPEDVIEAREIVGTRAAILSKIEKPAAVKAFDDILEVSDGIMVARGDLGVELPVQSVPPIQKRLVRSCRAAAKPVIVATQMLESMIESPMPTRAEVSDVASAIYEGADAVMLSAESAAGRYPVEAVKMMDNVAVEVESDPTYRSVIEASRQAERSSVADGIVSAAREIAETTDIKAICCFTESGTTALKTSRERPRVPIVALTPFPATGRRLCLSWGINCYYNEKVERFKMAVVSAARAARQGGYGEGDDKIIVIAGLPFNLPGSTNILRVAPCEERLIFNLEPE
ncbi:pyruvate kinase [Cereibacter sphaeroides]|nr:pyruvate kinase [Cereibacter sphaeroides]